MIASRLRWISSYGKVPNGDFKVIICALPKSGSTWLECILSKAYSLESIMPPEVSVHEVANGHSHTWVPSKRLISRLAPKSFLLKVHSDNNSGIKNMTCEWDSKVIVLERDLQEVLDSMYHYISVTKYHPEHNFLVSLSVLEAKSYLYSKYAPMYKKWIQSWNDDVLRIKYDDMLTDINKVLTIIENYLGRKVTYYEAVADCEISKMKKQAVHKNFYRGKRA